MLLLVVRCGSRGALLAAVVVFVSVSGGSGVFVVTLLSSSYFVRVVWCSCSMGV